jgi:hypothetical protein
MTTTTQQLNIIIGLLVILIIGVGYLVYKKAKKEPFKMVCDQCAALLDAKRDCNMINNPQYSQACKDAGEFLGQSPSWVEFCSEHDAACVDKPNAPDASQ